MIPQPKRTASWIEYKVAFSDYIPNGISPETMEVVGKSFGCIAACGIGLLAAKLAPHRTRYLTPAAVQIGAFIGGYSLAKGVQSVISNQISSYILKSNQDKLQDPNLKKISKKPFFREISTFDVEKFFDSLPREYKDEMLKHCNRIRKLYEEKGFSYLVH
ncbi:MAG: hypothetical protein JSS09_09710, partial [Verrucomicrobia bacterium]|nr:hypothetical protein [Verrucomicrobiota bacterium]